MAQKIDKRNFPGLFKGIPASLFEAMQARGYSGQDIFLPWEIAKQNIFYLSNTIVEIIDSSVENGEKFLDLRFEIDDVSRCILLKDINGKTYISAIYCISKIGEVFGFSMAITQKSIKGGMDVTAYLFGQYERNMNSNGYLFTKQCCFINDHKELYFVDFDDAHKDYCPNMVSLVIQAEVFLRYAEVETKIIKAGCSLREGVLCKYENKLPFHVTTIDSSYFTTLIKSGEFKVRGHFRLQPHGPLRCDRKLIWINEFKKHGYTRDAKILNQ